MIEKSHTTKNGHKFTINCVSNDEIFISICNITTEDPTLVFPINDIDDIKEIRKLLKIKTKVTKTEYLKAKNTIKQYRLNKKRKKHNLPEIPIYSSKKED